jgi:hypothetical protein
MKHADYHFWTSIRSLFRSSLFHILQIHSHEL